MVAIFSSPEFRSQRSRITSEPAHQEKLTKGRKQYWDNWRALPPEEQEAERKRRSDVANNPVNKANREQGKQHRWKEYWNLSSEEQEVYFSPEERQRRRERAMHPDLQRKFREGYRRFVENRRLLKAINAYGKPAGWENESIVPIILPDYVDEVWQREVNTSVHTALLELKPEVRALICELFDIEMETQEELGELSEEERNLLLREGFDSLKDNPILIQLIANEEE